ncbi:MAG: asparagine synthase C-terminal domain-containing protein, partial [Planctomycetes bacterium]|nr:asparagine synthase C-terminal domain-containing protein [Planctomycetota bacterium]
LPIELRSGPADTSFIGKKILKDLLEPTMGKDFVHRRKQGFGIPRSQWFMPDASGNKLFRDVALSSDGGLSEWFSSSVLERMLQEHSGKRDKSALLWLLLVLAIWRKNHRGIPFR